MSEQNPQDRFTKTPVAYQMPGTDRVAVQADIQFRGADGGPLPMDVYLPPDLKNGDQRPAVVIVNGYPDPGFEKMFGLKFTQLAAISSWGRLIAASGLIAVAYSNRDPVADLDAALDHVEKNLTSLGIDGARTGIWASSGHAPLALSALMKRRELKCVALLYPYTLDLDGATGVAAAAKMFRFAYAGEGKTVDDLPVATPLFVARAGKDEMPGLNDALDRVLAKAIARNLPLTFVNQPEGLHAFDIYQDSAMSRAVVRSVLTFLRSHLSLDRISG
ncbi:MAG: alpha/beta hydrolase [Acidobacteriota bacterium]|nr:alpha/beta hydrolase [Acidobacteriota bacterium]